MWYKISDNSEEVVFFVNCSLEQAEAFLMKKCETTRRKLLIDLLKEKPEGLVLYGCSRVDVPQKNAFVEVFVRSQKKGGKDPP